MIPIWVLVIFTIAALTLLFLATLIAEDCRVFACLIMLVAASLLVTAWHDYGYGKAMTKCGYEWVSPCQEGKWVKK